jgi:hypothetical protein
MFIYTTTFIYLAVQLNTFFLIKEVKDALILAMSRIEELADLSLRPVEWEMMKDLVALLSPFEAATRQLCGDTYQTIGHVIPAIQGLCKISAEMNFQTASARRLRDVLVQSRPYFVTKIYFFLYFTLNCIQ